MALAEKNLLIIFFTVSLFAISCSEDGNRINDSSHNPPEACFEMSENTAKVGDVIEFINCSSNSTFYTWNFGDENTSNQREPTHSYEKQGDYDVTLSAGEDSNGDGTLNSEENFDTVSKTITIDPKHKSAEFKIYDASSWTRENPNYSVVQNATVKLYSSDEALNSGNPDYEVKSNEEGVSTFYDMNDGDYHMLVEKNDMSNIVNEFILLGVFESQEDIDSHAEQEGASIGGYKYYDINGDGVINTKDHVVADPITISTEETLTKEIYIGK